MAIVGSICSQQGRSRPQALRQPARQRRQDGDPDGTRCVHAPQEGSSVWVVQSNQIVASDPGDKDMFFDPAEDKVYRHPTFFHLPKEVDHM